MDFMFRTLCREHPVLSGLHMKLVGRHGYGEVWGRRQGERCMERFLGKEWDQVCDGLENSWPLMQGPD